MTAHKTILPLVLATIALFPFTLAYQLGAPDGACDSMRTGHYNEKANASSGLQEPQTEAPVYRITVNKDKDIKDGDIVEVTIEGTDEKYIEGFLIQARDKAAVSDLGATGAEKYGEWIIADEVNTTQKLACSSKAVTHINNPADNNGAHFKWNNVTLQWRATGDLPEKFVFRATVVKGYSAYWVNVDSPDISTSGGAAIVPLAALLVAMVTAISALLS